MCRDIRGSGAEVFRRKVESMAPVSIQRHLKIDSRASPRASAIPC